MSWCNHASRAFARKLFLHVNITAITLAIPSASLKCGSSRKQRAIDSVDNRLSRDLSTTEETSVQAFDGVLATLNAVKLQVDVASGILI